MGIAPLLRALWGPAGWQGCSQLTEEGAWGNPTPTTLVCLEEKRKSSVLCPWQSLSVRRELLQFPGPEIWAQPVEQTRSVLLAFLKRRAKSLPGPWVVSPWVVSLGSCSLPPRRASGTGVPSLAQVRGLKLPRQMPHVSSPMRAALPATTNLRHAWQRVSRGFVRVGGRAVRRAKCGSGCLLSSWEARSCWKQRSSLCAKWKRRREGIRGCSRDSAAAARAVQTGVQICSFPSVPPNHASPAFLLSFLPSFFFLEPLFP